MTAFRVSYAISPDDHCQKAVQCLFTDGGGVRHSRADRLAFAVTADKRVMIGKRCFLVCAFGLARVGRRFVIAHPHNVVRFRARPATARFSKELIRAANLSFGSLKCVC